MELALPRAFLYDKSHPDFLAVLASLPHLRRLALGSAILEPLAEAEEEGEACARARGGGEDANVRCVCVAPRALRRQWSRLSLGCAMPCYLEELLPAMGVLPVCEDDEASRAAPFPSRALLTPAWADWSAGTPTACGRRLCRAVRAPRACGGGGGAAFEAGGGLRVLRLCSPCPLDAAMLMGRYVCRQPQPDPPAQDGWRRGSQDCSSDGDGSDAPSSGSEDDTGAAITPRSVAGPAASPQPQTPGSLTRAPRRHSAAPATPRTPAAPRARGGGCGGACGGVRNLRLVLRLAGNWRDALDVASSLGPALRALALLPTHLFRSGSMLPAEVDSDRGCGTASFCVAC